MSIHPRHRGSYLFDWRELSASIQFRRADSRYQLFGRLHGRDALYFGESL